MWCSFNKKTFQRLNFFGENGRRNLGRKIKSLIAQIGLIAMCHIEKQPVEDLMKKHTVFVFKRQSFHRKGESIEKENNKNSFHIFRK